MTLRYYFASLKKGNLSIVEFFQKMTSFIDTLTTIGQPLSDYELVCYVIVGLGLDYDPLITS